MKTQKNLFLRIIAIFSFFLLLFAIWEIWARQSNVNAYIFPSPLLILKVFFSDFHIILPHLIASLETTLIGIAIAVILAFVVAILMDISFIFRDIIYPLVLIFQIVPFILFVPLLIILLGYGAQTQIFAITLMVFFPMLVTLRQGLEAVSISQIKLLDSMGANLGQIYFHLKIPSALLHMFSGLRLAITYGITASVVSEWVGAINGLGVIMIRSQKSFLIARVFAINIVIIVTSLLLYGLVVLAEKKFLVWKKYL